MAMGYGGIKSDVPDIVPDARQKATSIINGYLNRTEDFETAPVLVNDAADWIAGSWIKDRTIDIGELVDMAAKLLETIKDDLNVGNGYKFANMRFI